MLPLRQKAGYVNVPDLRNSFRVVVHEVNQPSPLFRLLHQIGDKELRAVDLKGHLLIGGPMDRLHQVPPVPGPLPELRADGKELFGGRQRAVELKHRQVNGASRASLSTDGGRGCDLRGDDFFLVGGSGYLVLKDAMQPRRYSQSAPRVVETGIAGCDQAAPGFDELADRGELLVGKALGIGENQNLAVAW